MTERTARADVQALMDRDPSKQLVTIHRETLARLLREYDEYKLRVVSLHQKDGYRGKCLCGLCEEWRENGSPTLIFWA